MSDREQAPGRGGEKRRSGPHESRAAVRATRRAAEGGVSACRWGVAAEIAAALARHGPLQTASGSVLPSDCSCMVLEPDWPMGVAPTAGVRELENRT